MWRKTSQPRSLVSPKSMTTHLKWVLKAALQSYHISHLSGVTASNILSFQTSNTSCPLHTCNQWPCCRGHWVIPPLTQLLLFLTMLPACLFSRQAALFPLWSPSSCAQDLLQLSSISSSFIISHFDWIIPINIQTCCNFCHLKKKKNTLLISNPFQVLSHISVPL